MLEPQADGLASWLKGGSAHGSMQQTDGHGREPGRRLARDGGRTKLGDSAAWHTGLTAVGRHWTPWDCRWGGIHLWHCTQGRLAMSIHSSTAGWVWLAKHARQRACPLLQGCRCMFWRCALRYVCPGALARHSPSPPCDFLTLHSRPRFFVRAPSTARPDWGGPAARPRTVPLALLARSPAAPKPPWRAQKPEGASGSPWSAGRTPIR